MTDALIRRRLLSNDPDTILDGLFALSALRSHIPQPETFRLALEQFVSPDPDIRRQAVVAVVIHWGYVPAFESLTVMALAEQNLAVVEAVLSGLSRLSREEASILVTALGVLRRYCFSSHTDPSLKRRAFLEAKWAAGEVSAAEYASCVVTDGYDNPCEEWFNKTLQRLQSTLRQGAARIGAE